MLTPGTLDVNLAHHCRGLKGSFGFSLNFGATIDIGGAPAYLRSRTSRIIPAIESKKPTFKQGKCVNTYLVLGP